MNNKTVLNFSDIESAVLNLKIGRCNEDFFEQAKLFEQIISGEYDLCRLRIASEDEMASAKLSHMGMPFFFSGSIRRYKTKITQLPDGEYYHKNLQYEMYDGSQDELLRFMLKDTWGHYPIGYYRSAFLSRLINKEKEIESVFQYYRKFNNNCDYPSNSILFIRDGNNYVGFFALNVVDSNLESHIGGICKKYQQGKYFYDMLKFIKEHCVRHSLEHFIFGARNENTIVQHAFEQANFRSVATENVFHIASLLSHSTADPLKEDLKVKFLDSATLYNLLAEKVLKNYEKPSRMNQYSFSAKIVRQSSHESFHMIINHPINKDDEVLAVLKLYDKENNLIAFAHYNAKHS